MQLFKKMSQFGIQEMKGLELDNDIRWGNGARIDFALRRESYDYVVIASFARRARLNQSSA